MRPPLCTPNLDALRRRNNWPDTPEEFLVFAEAHKEQMPAIRDLILQASLADLQDHVLNRLDRIEEALIELGKTP